MLVGVPGAHAGTVRARNGATTTVADSAVGKFQCILDRLESAGYPVRFIGGWRRHGSVRGSLHPLGLALDVNQTSRNRTTPRMPRGEIELANGCGLVSGAQWRNADSGHFQVGGWQGTRVARASRTVSRVREAAVNSSSLAVYSLGP